MGRANSLIPIAPVCVFTNQGLVIRKSANPQIGIQTRHHFYEKNYFNSVYGSKALFLGSFSLQLRHCACACKIFRMRILYLILALAFLGSCASREQVVYLQPSESRPELDYDNLAPRIQAEDLLTITVSGADMNAILPFNQVNPYQNNVANSNDFAFKPTYVVDRNGEIDFPVLGKVKLG